MTTKWFDYTKQLDQPLGFALLRFPREWFAEAAELFLVPEWLHHIVQTWGSAFDVLTDDQVESMVTAVNRHGPKVASVMFVQLAAQFDRDNPTEV